MKEPDNVDEKPAGAATVQRFVRRCGWCGTTLTPNEELFPIYDCPRHVSVVIGHGCYDCSALSVAMTPNG